MLKKDIGPPRVNAADLHNNMKIMQNTTKIVASELHAHQHHHKLNNAPPQKTTPACMSIRAKLPKPELKKTNPKMSVEPLFSLTPLPAMTTTVRTMIPNGQRSRIMNVVASL